MELMAPIAEVEAPLPRDPLLESPPRAVIDKIDPFEVFGGPPSMFEQPQLTALPSLGAEFGFFNNLAN